MDKEEEYEDNYGDRTFTMEINVRGKDICTEVRGKDINTEVRGNDSVRQYVAKTSIRKYAAVTMIWKYVANYGLIYYRHVITDLVQIRV